MRHFVLYDFSQQIDPFPDTLHLVFRDLEEHGIEIHKITDRHDQLLERAWVHFETDEEAVLFKLKFL